MQSFRTERPKIPLGIGILAIGLRIAFLAVDKVWELDRIADEKHGRIVASDVPVAFFGVEFYCKPSGIAIGICRTFFSTDGREPQQDWSLLANFRK